VVLVRVVIEPAAQVSDGQTDEAPWPNGAVGADHTVHVDPEPTGGPSTTFTAKLAMPPLSTVTFPEKSANVVVFDSTPASNARSTLFRTWTPAIRIQD
jgi:hypothetical protein